MQIQYQYRVKSSGNSKPQDYLTLAKANSVAQWLIHFGHDHVSIEKL
jgi:hypothetical protein